MFDDLKSFCTFIGATRSGHSLVGALLDAHPNVVLPHEVDVFKRDENKKYTGALAYPDRDALLHALVERSERQARQGRVGHRIKPDGTRYQVSYQVPNQYQGRVTKLLVAGNKRGQGTAAAIHLNPDALPQLQDQVGVPLKLVHVVRNPFDNIATMSVIHKDRSTMRYFWREQAVGIAEAGGWDILHVRLERFIDRPQQELRRVCDFLGLDAPRDYLDDCASIVMPSPNRSRDSREWTQPEVRAIRKRMQQYEWFAPYLRGDGVRQPRRDPLAIVRRVRRKLTHIR